MCAATTVRRPARAGKYKLNSGSHGRTTNMCILSTQAMLFQVGSQMMAMKRLGMVKSEGMSEAVRAR